MFTQVSVDGNTTISTLRYSPTVTENNKSLKCRSENPNLPGSVIENFITLEVSCKSNTINYPKCSQQFLLPENKYLVKIKRMLGPISFLMDL